MGAVLKGFSITILAWMGGTDPVAHGMRGIANVQTTVTDVEIDQLSSEVVALRCGNALLFLVVCSRIPGGLPAEVVQGETARESRKREDRAQRTEHCTGCTSA